MPDSNLPQQDPSVGSIAIRFLKLDKSGAHYATVKSGFLVYGTVLSILQQDRNLGADAASATVQNIIEILNQSLGNTSTRQGQQQSGQSHTVDQDMARFQFCSHDNEKQPHCIQHAFTKHFSTYH